MGGAFASSIFRNSSAQPGFRHATDLRSWGRSGADVSIGSSAPQYRATAIWPAVFSDSFSSGMRGQLIISAALGSSSAKITASGRWSVGEVVGNISFSVSFTLLSSPLEVILLPRVLKRNLREQKPELSLSLLSGFSFFGFFSAFGRSRILASLPPKRRENIREKSIFWGPR